VLNWKCDDTGLSNFIVISIPIPFCSIAEAKEYIISFMVAEKGVNEVQSAKDD
jgi:hypothetical protein